MSDRRRPTPAAPADDHLRLTGWLLVLCVLAITHGSLYPWVFHAPAMGVHAAWHQLWSWLDRPLWTSGGDVVGNVVLFVPLGMLAWRASVRWPGAWPWRLTLITALSLAFALALQVAQIWLPTRSAAVSDVVWNALGLALGLPAAGLAQGPIAWLSRRLQSVHLVAYLVALFWLLLQWWPLLPLLDRRLLQAAWVQLLSIGQWQWLPAMQAGLALLVVMHLLRGLQARLWVAVALVLAAHVGSFFFVHKPGASVVDASHTVGWLVALMLGPALWSLPLRLAHGGMLMAAAAGCLIGALQPWVFKPIAAPFEFRPFVSLWAEPRVAHTSAFLWEGFWVLVILLLGQRLGWRLPVAAAMLTAAVAGIEVLHRWMPGQQADITPLLLPVACAWLLTRLLRRHERLHGPLASTMAP